MPFLFNQVAQDLAFLTLTESHLSGEISDVEIQIHNYTVFKTDRKDRSHRFIITYVRNDLALNTETLLSLSNGQAEVLVIQIKKLSLVVANIYCPPLCDKQNFSEIITMLQQEIEPVSLQTADKNYK